ncbi:MAG: alpha/beta fold hydrolase [Planctomycetota bacterium]
MKLYVPFIFAALAISLLPSQAFAQSEPKSEDDQKATFETITFMSGDMLKVTADLYLAHKDKATPLIVLCHQATWSRGEYREIAPKLNAAGFNCLAIDQRSGKEVNGVKNQTFMAASAAEKPTGFVDAEQDIIAAVKFAKENYAEGQVILWGSSYSSALTLRIAGEHPDLIDGAMAFAPGEYFKRFGKPDDWIARSAKKISDPVFITSAKNEYPRWKSIFEAIPGESKRKFVPETKGNHGSRALFERFDDSPSYWEAVDRFLDQFKPKPE